MIGAGALDRRITLVERGSEYIDSAGQARHHAEIEHGVWAMAKDRGAGEGIDGEMVAAETVRIYTCRWPGALPTERWAIRDDGETWNISNVLRKARGDWMIEIHAVRRR